MMNDFLVIIVFLLIVISFKQPVEEALLSLRWFLIISNSGSYFGVINLFGRRLILLLVIGRLSLSLGGLGCLS
jgi:hypothetical protein